MAQTWDGWYWHFGLASLLAMCGAIANWDCTLAQITPDGTLGAESSVVTPTNINGLPGQQIDGGATRGTNLFHSFEKFSIATGGVAYFNNAANANIQNIISRVTGGSVSDIDGLIKANGTANLYLLNPNGIIFGANASLNIGGSFIASTASSLNFADGTNFSATANPTTPLLTISVPIGLQFGGTAGRIVNSSQAHQVNNDGTVDVFGLKVNPGRILALVGGEIHLDGGSLKALNGKVELGGLAGAGTVKLDGKAPHFLKFPDDVARANVTLNNDPDNPNTEIAVNVKGKPGTGSIAITAHNLHIAGVKLRAGINDINNNHKASPGDIEINATGEVNLKNDSLLSNLVDEGAIGKGGNINITTGSLSLMSGATVSTTTKGNGDAGSVNITARSGDISFDGISDISNSEMTRSGAFSNVNPGATGSSGGINIKIETGSLRVTNGASIDASTSGQESAGNIFIKAPRGTISVDGLGRDNRPSAIYNQVRNNATGNSGNININTRSLSVSNGAQLSTRTQAQGKGGDITVNTNTLEAIGGGQVLTTSSGSGKPGNITLNVTDSITLSGSDPTYDAREKLNPNVVSGAGSASGLYTNTFENSTSQGGDLTITTGQLIVKDEARITARSQGTADAGNITLQVQDWLLLRNHGQISTDAANAKAGGNGGNITIDTPLLVAVASENSDITANAHQGAGGLIQITAQGVFGLERRSKLTLLSDITAFSQQNPELNGIVKINTPDIDPSHGLVTLPAELVDASVLIASGCGASRRQGENKFIVTGHGGLPLRPGDAHISPYPTGSVRSIPSSSPFIETPQSSVSGSDSTNSTIESTSTQIVEAKGWMINDKGEVVLTADAPNVTPNIPWLTPAKCYSSTSHQQLLALSQP